MKGMEAGLEGYDALIRAIGWMLADPFPTLETVGVAKALKCAVEIRRFEAELEQQGRKSYTNTELYERLKPIFEA